METEQGHSAPCRKPLTIEHIMPQKLSDKWRNDLGQASERIHEKYQNRIANLTLIDKEKKPKMRNASFEDKKPVYLSSGISMNLRIAREEIWGENA